MRHRHKHIKNRLRHLKPKRSLFTRPVFWLAFFAVIMLGGLFYLFFFFGPLQVQAISVTGNEKIASQEIENAVWKDINKKIFTINNKSIFMVDTAMIKRNLLTGFPQIENVAIKKHWFKNIELQISEREPAAVFCPHQGAQNCRLIDIHGVAFEPAYSIAGQLIVREGQIAVDENIMQDIVKVRDDLKNNFQIDIKEVISSSPLLFTTAEGWQIHVDPAQDIGAQITTLDLLLTRAITPAVRKNLDYIYLQYKDRAYYK